MGHVTSSKSHKISMKGHMATSKSPTVSRKSPVTRRKNKRVRQKARGKKQVCKKARGDDEDVEEDGVRSQTGRREKPPEAPALPRGLSASSSSSGDGFEEFDSIVKDAVF